MDLSGIDNAVVAEWILDSGATAEEVSKMMDYVSGGQYLKFGGKYNHEPVSVRDFIEHEDFLNKKNIIYPVVMDEITELNSGKYMEAVLTGSIGCAKTTIAIYTTAYQLYLLSCMNSPHEEFDLDPSSEIQFIFQSINATLAKSVDYERFKDMITASTYFIEHFPYDKGIISKMKFPNRIEVLPVSGAETAAIGQNVIGGVIDEVNYMAIVEKSKASIDGGTYNQAIALYNSISKRRKSRFMTRGQLPGMLCLVSSKRYPGQFTDIKEAEVEREIERTGTSSIFLYDKRSWDINPSRFTGTWFYIYIGTSIKTPHIIEDTEDLAAYDSNTIMAIPKEYLIDFETDLMNALREVAGVSTLAIHPFLLNVEAVTDSFERKGINSIISRNDVDFVKTNLVFYPKKFSNKDEPRWVHIDLALTGDSAGVSMGYVSGFKTIKRGQELEEILPCVRMDFSLEVKPPKGGEIQFHKIRALLYKLKECGLNIKWVSFDSFQSTDSQQLLRTKGYITGHVSMDMTTKPYDILKSCIYDGRFSCPKHPKLTTELLSLERDPKKGKIDHPATGSKDVSDSVAGVVFGLSTRRETWTRYGIPLLQIPSSITSSVRDVGNDNMKSK